MAAISLEGERCHPIHLEKKKAWSNSDLAIFDVLALVRLRILQASIEI